MKKITPLILIVGISLLSPTVSSTLLPQDLISSNKETSSFNKINTNAWNPDLLYDGNFTGWFGIKNDEENYDVIGYIQGNFIYKIGFFTGQWNMTDDSLGGYIIGFFGKNFIFGWIQTGIGKFFLLGAGLPFMGSYQINETTQEFSAEIFRFIIPNIHFHCEYCIFEE
jgi:hypothetical protein